MLDVARPFQGRVDAGLKGPRYIGTQRFRARRRGPSSLCGPAILAPDENPQVRGLVACHAGHDPRRRPDPARRPAPRAGHRRGLGVSGRHQPAARMRAPGRAGGRRLPRAVRPDRAAPSVGGRRTSSDAGRRRARAQVDALLAELGEHAAGHPPAAPLPAARARHDRELRRAAVGGHRRRLSRQDASRPPFVDARDFIVTDDQFTHANVIFRKTNRRTRALLRQRCFGRARGVIPVVTGFIGATEDGQTTTIGRNGSDYSAAIVGAAVGASVIEIWTDVDGVLSADPRVVPAAFVLPQMTYEEAMELSYFGAKVLHSATIAPAVAKRIPILIKNTFNPDAPGTLISRKARGRREAGEGHHVGRRPGAADAARPGDGRRARRRRAAVPHARRRAASTSC